MTPVIDHIQITVKDMKVALPFYDKLMPLLGFNLENRTNAVVQSHEFHVVEYVHPQIGVWHQFACSRFDAILTVRK